MRLDRHLPLAVVAERRGLEHRRPADAVGRRRPESTSLRTGGKRRDRQAAIAQKRLLANPMLRDLERAAVRPARSRALRPHAAAAADTFSNSKVTTSTPRANSRIRSTIVVRGDDLDVGDLSGRRVVFGRERMDAIAQPPRGHREHAAELTAAEDADHRAGRDRRAQSRKRVAANRVGNLAAIGLQLRAKFGTRGREDGDREQSGIGRARGRSRPSPPARLSASARSTAANRVRSTPRSAPARQ